MKRTDREEGRRSPSAAGIGTRRHRLAIVLAAIAIACSSGGQDVANGGMSGTGISSGPVTGFGSAFVNDIEWTVSRATIEVDGARAREADLRLGMIVTVRGRISDDGLTGRASTFVADASIEGPIDAMPTLIGTTTLSFTIYGMPVEADLGITVFDDGATFDGLMAGDVVEVYGIRDETGTLVATRIEGEPGGSTEAEIEGVISGLMTNLDEFRIGSAVIDYDGSTVFDDGLSGEGDLSDGLRVEVKGTRTGPSRILASRIEREDGAFGVEDARDAKLRGYVDDLAGSQFSISGQAVDASSATFDPPGLVLVEGLYVEVEGRLESGVLIADEVELEDPGDRDGDSVEIQARVPAGGKNAFGPNTLGMLDPMTGIEVQVSSMTLYDDKRDDVSNFGFSDIADGDWLEIRAVAVDAANGIVVATRVERDDDEDDVILQGPVTNAASTSFEILGQPIAEAGSAQYRDAADQSISRATFFGTIGMGDVVKVEDKSALDISELGPADELEIEAFD